jgi:hypothetical protein
MLFRKLIMKRNFWQRFLCVVRIGKKEMAETASKKQALGTSRIAILDRPIE